MASMNNLIIGNTSQLSKYFPEDYIKISSRDINFKLYENLKFDTVYITFAEQRTFMCNSIDKFMDVNYYYTINIIDFFSKISNKIVFYSTSELWNNVNGEIDIITPFNFNNSDYIISKYEITNYIINKRVNGEYNNVIILYPFNFNSIYRKGDFLFGKVYNSIINEKQITIGDTYFYRELLHPKYVVSESLKANVDMIIGNGRLIFINDFIRELYDIFSLDYNDYVIEDYDNNLNVKRNIFYLKSNKIKYNNLLVDTIYEIRKEKNKFSK